MRVRTPATVSLVPSTYARASNLQRKDSCASLCEGEHRYERLSLNLGQLTDPYGAELNKGVNPSRVKTSKLRFLGSCNPATSNGNGGGILVFGNTSQGVPGTMASTTRRVSQVMRAVSFIPAITDIRSRRVSVSAESGVESCHHTQCASSVWDKYHRFIVLLAKLTPQTYNLQ